MLSKILRVVLGFLLLPFCFALTRAFFQVLVNAQASIAKALWLIGGISLFVACWYLLPRPVKLYVLGHELTHALWGLLFFAKPSKLRVTEKGGSVNLTKTNILITLAPYFFPFYTFIVILTALITRIFIEPLSYIPVWLFFIGATWAFHVLFTMETLTQHQPDITVYGRVFSWVFIFVVNVLLILVWLAYVTSTFNFAMSATVKCTIEAYEWTYNLILYLISLFR